MFLNVPDRGVPDFLTALGFIAPRGYSADYFLLPPGANDDIKSELNDNGFFEPEITNKFNSENITYMKKDPSTAHSFSDSPAVTSDPELLAAEFPRHSGVENEDDLNTPLAMKTGVKAIQVKECRSVGEVSYILKESICGLPKNTLVSFSKLKG